MLTTKKKKKSTAQSLQARPGASLYFAVCEQGGQQSVSQEVYRMRRKERLACKFPNSYVYYWELLHTHTQIHTTMHLFFSKQLYHYYYDYYILSVSPNALDH